MQKNFLWSKEKQPHYLRQKRILKEYPEIQHLYGYDYRTKYMVTLVWLFQIWMSIISTEVNWCTLFFLTFFISGTCNNFLSLAIHECSHNLLFESQKSNELYSIFANIPIGVPMAISFKKYHLDHHYYMGDSRKDVDIPTDIETHIFKGRFGKFMFLVCNPILYGLRPFLKNAKPVQFLEIINIIVQFFANKIIYDYLGEKAILYLLGGTFLGMGLHPLAAHFVSEHYVTETKAQETYSYYGILNWLTLNVGYHNEHHDFPKISGLRLPHVHQLAKTHYLQIHYYKSWLKVINDFIFDPDIQISSRVKR
jgi:sphingolipid delta-4 desaturase